MRTHAKLQVILSINSLFTNHLKLTCQSRIRLFVLKGLKAKKIFEQLLEVYKESSPSKQAVEFWAGEFKRGRTNQQHHNILIEDPSVTKREYANVIGISERVLHILHGELNMKKLFGKLVLLTLTIQQKTACSASKELK